MTAAHDNVTTECRTCVGTGTTHTTDCPDCNGSGYTTDTARGN